jgi:hypothetical protein
MRAGTIRIEQNIVIGRIHRVLSPLEAQAFGAGGSLHQISAICQRRSGLQPSAREELDAADDAGE